MKKEFEVIDAKPSRTSNELGGNFSEFRLTLLKKGEVLERGETIYSSEECPGCIVREVNRVGKKLFCTLQIKTNDPEEIVPFQTTLAGAVWFSQ